MMNLHASEKLLCNSRIMGKFSLANCYNKKQEIQNQHPLFLGRTSKFCSQPGLTATPHILKTSEAIIYVEGCAIGTNLPFAVKTQRTIEVTLNV